MYLQKISTQTKEGEQFVRKILLCQFLLPLKMVEFFLGPRKFRNWRSGSERTLSDLKGSNMRHMSEQLLTSERNTFFGGGRKGQLRWGRKHK